MVKKMEGFLLLMAAFVLLPGMTVSASEIADSDMDESIMKEIEAHVFGQNPSLKEAEIQSLAKEIYEEKYMESMSLAADETDGNFVDEAYENMLEKETYIVELISSHSGERTSRESWEYNLEYLKQHYEEIMGLESINAWYVDSYIEDYEVVRDTKDMPASRINSIPRASYSSAKAVEYAEKYYSNYNSAYPNWGEIYNGDCANFISQCLYAGGKSMKGTPGTADAATDWSNWFSKGTSCDTKNVSSTWRGANAFKGYWQNNANGYSKFTSVSADSYKYGYKGDAVSLLNENGSAYHTMIIVGYDSANNDFKLAAHTGNTKTASIRDYSPVGGFIIFDM